MGDLGGLFGSRGSGFGSRGSGFGPRMSGSGLRPPRSTKRARSYSPAKPSAVRPGRLAPGSEVWVCDLVKSAQFNGKIGTVQSFTQEKQRYTVRFDTGQQIALKPGNLVQPLTVAIAGVASKPSLNGKNAKIVGFSDKDGERAVVATLLHGQISLSMSNIILPRDAAVRVRGLMSAEGKQHNGKLGTVTSFDGQKYTVKLSEAKSLKLGREKVTLRLSS